MSVLPPFSRRHDLTHSQTQSQSLTFPTCDISQIDWEIIAQIIDSVPPHAERLEDLDTAHDQVMQRFNLDPASDDLYYRILLKIHEVKAPTLRDRFSRLLRALQADEKDGSRVGEDGNEKPMPPVPREVLDSSKIHHVQRWLASTSTSTGLPIEMGSISFSEEEESVQGRSGSMKQHSRPKSSTPIKTKVPFLEDANSDLGDDEETDTGSALRPANSNANSRIYPGSNMSQKERGGFQQIDWDYLDNGSYNTIGYTLSNSLLDPQDVANDQNTTTTASTIINGPISSKASTARRSSIPPAYGGPTHASRHHRTSSGISATTSQSRLTTPVTPTLNLPNIASTPRRRSHRPVVDHTNVPSAHATTTPIIAATPPIRALQSTTSQLMVQLENEAYDLEETCVYDTAAMWEQAQEFCNYGLKSRMFRAWLGVFEYEVVDAVDKIRQCEQAKKGRLFKRWRAMSEKRQRSTVYADRIFVENVQLATVEQWREALRGRRRQREADEMRKAREERLRKEAWTTWLGRVKNKAKEKWSVEMKRKEVEIRSRGERKITEKCFQIWRDRQLHDKAVGFEDNKLLRGAFSTWSYQVKHRADLRNKEGSLTIAQANRLVKQSFRKWKRIVDLNKIVETHGVKVDRELQEEGWARWRTTISDCKKADEFRSRMLKKTAVKRWRDRMTGMKVLARKAHSIQVVRESKLSRAALQVWAQQYRCRYVQEKQRKSLKASALLQWKDKIQLVQKKNALASEIDKARCQELIQDCLTTWRSLFAARQRDLGRADDLELTFIQRNAFASWRRCYHQQSHLKEQAVKTRAFFLQKQAFSDWMIRCRKRKQEKWMDQQRLDVCRKAFTNWSVKTVRHRLLHRLEKQIIARQQLEISSKTIGKWVNRLVEIKSQMVSVVESRERGLLKNTFSKWSKRTLELGEYHSLMLSFRVVKDKEDLGRLFQFWRMSAERTASLREVGEALRVMQERRSLATALEQWRYRHREIEMAPKVDTLLQRRDDVLLFATLLQWQKTSKRLPAIRFQATKLKSKAWAIWREALPEAIRLRAAKKEKELRILEDSVYLWKCAYRAKVARRAVARQRGNTELLRIRTSTTPPPAQLNLAPGSLSGSRRERRISVPFRLN